MDMDFEKALTYISKDTQWGNKLLAGAGLMLASFAVFLFPLGMMLTGSLPAFAITLFVSLLFSLLLWFAISGYICETAFRRIQNPNDNVLPDWNNFGLLLSLGLKYFLGYFLYVLPVCLVGLLFGFFMFFGFAASHSGYSGAGILSFMFLAFFGAFLVFLYILTIVFLPLVMANFFRNKKILSFINFKEAFGLLKNNVSNYLVLILLFIAMTMLSQILCSFLIATIIGIILLPLVYMYVYYVIADLSAQFVLTSQKKCEQEQITENNDNPSC